MKLLWLNLMRCIVFYFSTFIRCSLIEYLLQCYSGYFGIDCSIPSAYSLAYDWPLWLQTPVNLPDLKFLNSTTIDVKAVVQKKRPLIYVYDLPAEFDSHLLEVSPCHKYSFLCSWSFTAALRLIFFSLSGTTLQIPVCKQNIWWQEQNSMDPAIVWCSGLLILAASR